MIYEAIAFFFFGKLWVALSMSLLLSSKDITESNCLWNRKETHLYTWVWMLLGWWALPKAGRAWHPWARTFFSSSPSLGFVAISLILIQILQIPHIRYSAPRFAWYYWLARSVDTLDRLFLHRTKIDTNICLLSLKWVYCIVWRLQCLS